MHKVLFHGKTERKDIKIHLIKWKSHLFASMPGACQNNHSDGELIPVAISHSHFRDFTDEPATAPRMNCAMFDKVHKSLGHLLLLHKSDSLLMLKSYQKRESAKMSKKITQKKFKLLFSFCKDDSR